MSLREGAELLNRLVEAVKCARVFDDELRQKLEALLVGLEEELPEEVASQVADSLARLWDALSETPGEDALDSCALAAASLCAKLDHTCDLVAPESAPPESSTPETPEIVQAVSAAEAVEVDEESPESESTESEPAEPEAAEEEDDALFTAFLQETEDGLGQADQVLLSASNDGATAEGVNSLFRVFHSIKGVAGFLDLADIGRLAHTTESLLNEVRGGTRELEGDTLDLVFDATAMMRTLVAGLTTNRSSKTPVELTELLERFAASGEGSAGVPARSPSRASDSDSANSAETLESEASSEVDPEAVRPRSTSSSNASSTSSTSSSGGGQSPVARETGDARKLKETLKVDVDRVDSLVEIIGELVIVESMVTHAPELAGLSSPRVRNYLSQLTKITRDLQDIGMRMRMVPLRAVFQKTARAARDTARKAQKRIRIDITGESAELDRSVVEQVGDPLIHLVRNAVDHGLESEERRRQVGKPPVGTVRLSAYHEGSSVVIEISDDGAGLNREAILNKARQQGIVREGEELQESQIDELIFAPGFSTAKQVTELSGRGVGMDVVKRNIEALRGRVIVSTVPGAGTSFKMVLPLTLAIIEGMVVRCGDEHYIIPTLSIVESLQPDPACLYTMGGRFEVFNVRGDVLPLIRLNRMLGSGLGTAPSTLGQVVVVEALGRKVALMVDDILTQQQVVIKNLGQMLSRMAIFSGAAILSDGRVGLIINVDELAMLTADDYVHPFVHMPVQQETPSNNCNSFLGEQTVPSWGN